MKVWVNILNWQQPESTLRCIESTIGHGASIEEILLIDNGSVDESRRIFDREVPFVQKLYLDQNYGFAGGHNRGMAYAFDQGAEAVLLLNNDCVLMKGAIESLCEAAEGDSQIGLVASKVYLANSVSTLWYAGGKIDPWRGLAWNHGIGKSDRSEFCESGDTEYATGCSVLVTKSLFQGVGPMDDRYFLYFEDVDWSLRARQAGFRVCYEPQSRVKHASGLSSRGAGLARIQYYLSRNPFHLLRAHGRWYHWLYFIPFHLRHRIAHGFRAWRGGRSLEARAFFLGVWDGLRGRVGRLREAPSTADGVVRLG